MLLRFGATNYLSISAPTEISLVATRLKGAEAGLIPIQGINEAALPSALIYGANASGKTNILKAFSFMRSAVLYSHSQGSSEFGVPRKPFSLGIDLHAQPSVLEADFVVDGVRYHYGFRCSDTAFEAEWLYAYPDNRRRLLFERTEVDVQFGSHFKGTKRALVGFMRPYSLFISTATQNHHPELSKITEFFRQAQLSFHVAVAKELVNQTFKKDQIDERVFQFLRIIGTGVEGYRQIEVEIPEEVQAIQDALNTKLKELYGEKGVLPSHGLDRGTDVLIEFEHKTVTGQSRYFGLERESLGTRRLLLLLNMAFRALDQGSLLLIDEIDAGLHTLAAAQLIQLFSDKKTNPNGAQLIAATHDTNLLNAPSLRRDQIWFCEKNIGGSTDVFPLSDIKSRTTDDFEQGYLQGRYGAIPFSGDLSSLVGAK